MGGLAKKCLQINQLQAMKYTTLLIYQGIIYVCYSGTAVKREGFITGIRQKSKGRARASPKTAAALHEKTAP